MNKNQAYKQVTIQILEGKHINPTIISQMKVA